MTYKNNPNLKPMAGRGKEFMIYRDVVTGEVFGAYPEKAQENMTNQKPATFQ